jgi:hypothetical protein
MGTDRNVMLGSADLEGSLAAIGACADSEPSQFLALDISSSTPVRLTLPTARILTCWFSSLRARLSALGNTFKRLLHQFLIVVAVR